MARCLWVVVALAVLLPLSSAQTLVGNSTQVTDLCDAQFCLAGSPAACGGLCFLTAASDDTTVSTFTVGHPMNGPLLLLPSVTQQKPVVR